VFSRVRIRVTISPVSDGLAPKLGFSGWRPAAALLFLAAAPAILVSIDGAREGVFLMFLSGVLTFLLIQGILRASTSRGRGRARLQVLAAVGGLYGAFIALLVAYRLYTGSLFDPAFALESVSRSLLTALRSVSPALLAAVLVSLVLVFEAIRRALVSSVRGFDRAGGDSRWPMAVTAVAAVLVLLIRPLHARLIEPTADSDRHPVRVAPIFPETGDFRTSSTDTIVLLQLESVNALAVNGVIEATERDPLEGERHLMPFGIYFPFFVAQGWGTTRGQEAILCGAEANLGPALADRPGPLPTPCLPELLRRSGYRTIFMANRLSPDFANTRSFMERAGFDELHFADFMKPDDPKTGWGFYDETFYRRAFADLRARYPKPAKLFLYFAMSAEHFPFNVRTDLPNRTIFPNASNPLERYMNSAAYQDEGLKTFWDEYRKYTAGEAHLLVAPDHSFPVGEKGSPLAGLGGDTNNSLTTFLYVPPASRRGNFAVATKVNDLYGQSDIEPTIFELLNGRPYPRSFAAALRGSIPPGAPWAHFFAMPFRGGYLSAFLGDRNFIYSYQTGRVTSYRLAGDLRERRPGVVWPDSITDLEFMKRLRHSRSGSGSR